MKYSIHAKTVVSIMSLVVKVVPIDAIARLWKSTSL